MLMTDALWERIKFFKKTEKWGDWTKLHAELVFLLDAFRLYVGKSVIIHNAYSAAGHSDDSYHYLGMAVDLHVKGLSLVDQFIAASRFDGFNGIGLYPDWTNPGLHLDIRPHKLKFEPDARWIRNVDYIGLTAENLKLYCL